MDDSEFCKVWLEELVTMTRKELYEKEQAAYKRGYADGRKDGEASEKWENFNRI